MITITTYKLQGNGADSWHLDTHDCDVPKNATLKNRISREIVFEDPENSKKVLMSDVDILTMTTDQLNHLKELLNL